MLTTAFITSPRPDGTVYLRSTYESYRREWDYVPKVFSEPKSYVPRGLPDCRNHTILGCAGNWFNAASVLLDSTSTPYIMIQEDDIEWTSGAARQVRSLLLTEPRNHVVSPYCAKIHGYSMAEYTWHEPRLHSPASWCGSCCMIFPRKILEGIVVHKDEFFEAALDKPTGIHYHLDSAISVIIYKLGYKIMTHTPTLIFHTGDISTFEGNNCPDARQLPARQPNI